jgi:hypothetical protein
MRTGWDQEVNITKMLNRGLRMSNGREASMSLINQMSLRVDRRLET